MADVFRPIFSMKTPKRNESLIFRASCSGQEVCLSVLLWMNSEVVRYTNNPRKIKNFKLFPNINFQFKFIARRRKVQKMQSIFGWYIEPLQLSPTHMNDDSAGQQHRDKEIDGGLIQMIDNSYLHGCNIFWSLTASSLWERYSIGSTKLWMNRQILGKPLLCKYPIQLK